MLDYFFQFHKYDIVEMIAHNNTNFDQLILMKEYKHVDERFLPSNVVFWDTLPFLRDMYPTEKSFSLPILYESFYKDKFVNAHRADADVKALIRIYVDKIGPYRHNVTLSF